MKHLRSFLESVGNNPSLEEVKSYFHNVIEDFCDQQSQDFTFEIYCNHYISNQVDPLDEIKWVQFQIKSSSNFDITDIYPVFKKLFDWSKFNGANLDEFFTANENIVFTDKSNRINNTKITKDYLHSVTFDLSVLWKYTCTFCW
jgi:hypothetical protein